MGLRRLRRQRKLHARRGRLRAGKPIARGKCDAPDVAGNFQLDAHLKQLAHRARALDPGNARPHRARLVAGLRVGHFQRHPHVLQDIVFGLVAGPVAIDDQRRSAFLEGTAQRVHTRHRKRHGLHNPRGAALMRFLLWTKIRFRHDCSPG
jgi:hypothetical protein